MMPFGAVDYFAGYTMENYKSILSSPIPSISTPFMPNGEVDFASLDKMVEQYISWGNTVLMLTAGDSNFACMSDREIADVTYAVLKQARHRAFVIVADRYFATNAALEFAQETQKRGADCYMALPPDWAGSTMPDELTEHYRAIASILPVMVVTNLLGARGAMGFGMEVCRRIADIPEIIAVKDDVCGVFGRNMATLLGNTKAVIAGGQKQNHFDLAMYGACGYLATFARFQPAVTRLYWKAWNMGNYPACIRIIRELDNPYFALVSTFRGGFNAGIYGSLEIAGIASRYRRKPYTTISDAEMERLKAFHDSVPEKLASIETEMGL